MRRGYVLSAVVGLGISLSGCGTVMSRGQQDVFGAYPFQAVGVDAVMLYGGFGGARGADTFVAYGLMSLPFDLVIDAVLCPLDLIAWAFGSHKGPPPDPPR